MPWESGTCDDKHSHFHIYLETALVDVARLIGKKMIDADAPSAPSLMMRPV